MIEQLLPAAVACAETFGDGPGEPSFPGEEQLIARAVEGRRREVVTGRRCAREALAKLGCPPAAIPRGHRGQPVWPAGVTGSITHCPGYRAAAVARIADAASLGIDAEPHDSVPADVANLVIATGERAMLDALSVADRGVHWERLLFSAKESIFKAWYPLTGRELGFDEADLVFDPATGGFVGRLSADGARIDGSPPLREVTGRYLVGRRFVLTAVIVEP